MKNSSIFALTTTLWFVLVYFLILSRDSSRFFLKNYENYLSNLRKLSSLKFIEIIYRKFEIIYKKIWNYSQKNWKIIYKKIFLDFHKKELKNLQKSLSEDWIEKSVHVSSRKKHRERDSRLRSGKPQ